ncbi:DUF4124 domain-containing protein [Wohlfahrtiimonas chitiniclastica]|uniref:DUF4124 domain-containing protein n=1 Tax=Wohlfahrtiimonas chitiniclastica TaxID=400946 RepID=UPI001FEF04FD|nr:DUF4124 domain-containing protein [Wohlfahrtiimonas chitiniclastica]
MKKSFYICLFILCSMSAHAQQMYRWTDSEGVVHYTEYAPEETREQILNFKDNEEKSAPASVKKVDIMRTSAAVLVEMPNGRKAVSNDNDAPVATNLSAAQKMSEMTFCQTVQANIATFEALKKGDVASLMWVSRQGETIPMNDTQIDAHYKANIDNLEQYCLQ